MNPCPSFPGFWATADGRIISEDLEGEDDGGAP